MKINNNFENYFAYEIIIFCLVEVLVTIFIVLILKFDWFSFELQHCFCGFVYQLIVVPGQLLPFHLFFFIIPQLSLQDLLFLISMNLFYFPYLFFFVMLEVLFSFQKQQMIHKEFDKIELSI